MRIGSSFDEGVTFLTVTGEVDIATAEDLAEAGEKAITEVCGTLRIDLSGVTFIDSTGIGALIRIRNAAAETTKVILDNPSRQVLQVLEITGLVNVFTIDPAPNPIAVSA